MNVVGNRKAGRRPGRVARPAIEGLETRSLLSADSLTVPLHLVNAGGGVRIAVDVSVAKGPYRPYLLDTGSVGMYVANDHLDPSAYTRTNARFAQHYTSGIHFSGPDILTDVSFARGQDAAGVYIGLITKATGKKVAHWNWDLKHDRAPYEHHFYGTLGMSLVPGSAQKQGGLYSIIAQLPGNLDTGFIIHTGGIHGTHPTLTIGLTPENMQGFTTIRIPPAATPGGTYSYGNGKANGVLAWNDKGGRVHYSIQGLAPFTSPTVFDTGEAATTLYTGGIPKSLRSGGRLASNLQFAARLGHDLTWSFTTGTTANVNAVNVGAARAGAPVNSGIGLFFAYDVMYDIKDGLIGFRTTTAD